MTGNDPHRSNETTTGTDPDATFDRPGYEDVSLGQAADRDARLVDDLVAESDDLEEAERRFSEEATGAPALRDRPGDDGNEANDDSRDPARLFELYLGDHLGGAAGAMQITRRSSDRNSGTQLGAFLADLHDQLADERDTLERMASDLGAQPPKWKASIGKVVGVLGSLKPSGHLVTYSPLSRVLELEALMSAVEAKLQLWDTLRFLHTESRPDSARELDELTEQANAQLDGLRTHHREAVALAFVAS